MWTDLQTFYFNLEKHDATIVEMHHERATRINQVEMEKRQAREEQERRQREYAERMRIANIEREQRRRDEEHLKATIFERTCAEWGIPLFTEMTGRNDWEQSFLRDMIVKINSKATGMARNSRTFNISEKQKARVIKIVNREDEEATEKQLAYIRSLIEKMVNTNEALLLEVCANHAVEMLDNDTFKLGNFTKRQASDLIGRLKNPPKVENTGDEEE